MIMVKDLISRCDRRKLCQALMSLFKDEPEDPEKAISGLSRFIDNL